MDGTTVQFDFWGTADGRRVVVDGPHPYDRQHDGAVKATLRQTVTNEDTVLVDDTFYSRYKSPNLFPHVVNANDPHATASPPPQPTPAIIASPTPHAASPQPKASPTAPTPLEGDFTEPQ